MELLNPLSFASIKASSSDSLNRIASHFIAKYLSADRAGEFRRACENLDYTKANQILDETIAAIGGCNRAAVAISLFADKFPELNLDLSSAYGETDKVNRISEKSDEILSTIEQQLVRRHKMEIWIRILILIFVVVGGIAVAKLISKSNRNNKTSAARKSQGHRRLASSQKPRYTKQDRDMIKLMQALSEVYQKTDEYMKK